MNEKHQATHTPQRPQLHSQHADRSPEPKPEPKLEKIEVREGDTVVYREHNPVTGTMHDCLARVTRAAGDRLDLIATYNVGPEDRARHAVTRLDDAKKDGTGWRPLG